MWKQVPAASPDRDFTRPLNDPLASETEYSAPSGPSRSGVIVSPPSPGGSARVSTFSPGFWSGAGPSGSSPAGRYSGSAPPTGRGGGWDNLYPSRPAPSSPSLPPAARPQAPSPSLRPSGSTPMTQRRAGGLARMLNGSRGLRRTNRVGTDAGIVLRPAGQCPTHDLAEACRAAISNPTKKWKTK